MTKILVVEDDQDIRDLLVDSLTDLGYDVVEAADGGAGFRCALDEPPDIILLDVMMPIMDGFEVLEKLKGDPATSPVPVIMVSAKGQEQDIKTAMDAGASNYLVKPWDLADLEAVVRGAADLIAAPGLPGPPPPAAGSEEIAHPEDQDERSPGPTGIENYSREPQSRG